MRMARENQPEMRDPIVDETKTLVLTNLKDGSSDSTYETEETVLKELGSGSLQTTSPYRKL